MAVMIKIGKEKIGGKRKKRVSNNYKAAHWVNKNGSNQIFEGA
jgi:hypothetical protein